MADVSLRATIPFAGLAVAIAGTTGLCRAAQEAHGLSLTSAIALGRLLTSAILLASTGARKGNTSLQVVARGRVRQIFADATHEGHARGFVRNVSLAFPLLADELPDGRRSISQAVMPGRLSVIRSAEGLYTQSATELVSGEVDEDVEHFLERSDQIPTALRTDVTIDTSGEVALAGGVLVQALPGADLDRLRKIRARFKGSGFVEIVRKHGSDARHMLQDLLPDAIRVDQPIAPEWKCRCSKERLLAALPLISANELADLVIAEEPVKATCDLCSKTYVLEHSEVEAVFIKMIKAQG